MAKKVAKKIDKMNKDVEKPLKVRFCPECKSTDVGFVFRMKNLFGLLPKVECTRCGHRDVVFPLLIVKPSVLKKKVDKMKKAKKVARKKTKKVVKKVTKKKLKKVIKR